MKIFTILFCFLLCNFCLADNIFYCPYKIICSKDGDIKSCTPIGGTMPIKSFYQVLSVKKSTYSFDSANGTMNSFMGGNIPEMSNQCVYLSEDDKNINKKYPHHYIYLSSSKTNLIPYTKTNNLWKAPTFYDMRDYLCEAYASPDACPFIVWKK